MTSTYTSRKMNSNESEESGLELEIMGRQSHGSLHTQDNLRSVDDDELTDRSIADSSILPEQNNPYPNVLAS
jgi:hypothetical protein